MRFLVVEVTGQFPSRETIISSLLTHVPAEKKDVLCDFLIRLYAVYEDLHCPSSPLHSRLAIRAPADHLMLVLQTPTSRSTP